MPATAIYAAINEGRHGAAKSMIEKELAKSPRNCAYLALDAYLEFKKNNRAGALQLIRDIVAVGTANLATVNTLVAPVLLTYYDPVLLSASLEQINRRTPQDIQAVELWVEFMVMCGNTRCLTKALMVANKQKSSRESLFGTCFMMYVVYCDAGPKDPERQLYPALAGRLIAKVLPPRTPQEAFAYAMILKMQDETKMIDYALDPAQESLRTMDLDQEVLAALTRQQMWERLYPLCTAHLKRIDSYDYWLGLVSSAVALGKAAEARSFMKEFTGNNAWLAEVELEKQLLGTVECEAMLAPLKQYWQAMRTKPSAFEYLRPYVRVPGLVQHVSSQQSDVTATVNATKLRYLAGEAFEHQTLLDLYETYLQDLPAEKTDYFAGTDFILLAALQVLATAGLELRREKAAVLLEHACQNDPSNFYVRLWLIHIYRSLGALEKARGHFERLSIKSMQWETLGYLMLSRAGTLYPDKKLFEQSQSIYTQADNIYQASQIALAECVATQLPSMLDLQRRLTTSLARALRLLEHLRMQRVLGGTVVLSSVLTLPTSFTDNRDFSTRFDPREAYGDMATLGLDTGPLQRAEWAKCQIAKELYYLAALRGESAELNVEAAAKEQLTAAENWNIQVVRSLADAGTEIPPQPSLGEVDWQFFHNAYTILETCKVVDDFYAKTKPTSRPIPTKALRQSVREATAAAIAGLPNRAAQCKATLASFIAGRSSIDSHRVSEGITNTMAKGLHELSTLANK